MEVRFKTKTGERTDGWADIRPTLVLRSVVGDDKDMSDSLRD